MGRHECGSRQSLRLTDRAAPDSDPAQPLFIAPSGYRPNAIFVGMQRELSELDRSLLDPATRDKGTACVLLCGLSGGGKSHLARQYVYTRRHLFPGGIFWVRAKSKTEIAQGFWDIAQKAALKDVQDPASARFEQDTEVFVKTVKTWFEARQEWLLVFDGVSIDGEAELAALQAFLPDSRNSSVILTSVDKSLGGRHRLLNPVSVRVMPLSEENSRQLLFEELNIKKPSKAQVEKATELAQKVGGLPLAIHAIGHRVRETQEPLVKYHIRPYSSDPKLREPFIEIMEDLDRLQHYQARDLAYILCFFREHIPVEMIQLGVKALRPFRVEVKARNSGSRPELNTTFGILMRYALIDRNDTDDGASQRSGGSGGSGAVESIDTLKMHSVVQTFLCEMLKGSGWLPIWLTYAVKVYCFSFREADGRIKKGAGLIKDYREYENHGARLMEHLQRNLVKSAELAPVRDELDRVLRALRESVRELTPELLHEAIGSHYYKVSVFDRTSSSSSAGPETPQMSTADLPAFGLPGMDSPAPFFSDAPRPEVVKYSPRAPYQGEDAGYLSDLDQPGRQKGFPGQEPSRPSRLGTEVDEEEWETASRRRKGKRTAKENQPPSHRTLVGRQRRRYRDSVNAWRIIEPSRLQPHVTRINVPRTDSPEIRSASRGAAGRTSEAELTLASFHRGSPPTRHALSPPQSFANALSGRTSPAPAQTGDGEQHTPSAGQATPMRRGRSGESPHSVRSDQGPSHHQFSPPLPGSALPVPPNRTPQGSTHSSPGPHYPDPMQSSDPDLRNLPGLYVNDRRYYHGQHRQPAVHGRNPDPLPFEDVSTGGKRQLPTDFHGHRRHQTLSSSMHNTRGSEYALSSHPDVRGAYQQPALAGYSSQPMSRNVSAQSVPTHPSVTDTEPARFPPEFSPASPRGRFRDGAPMRKSPKLGAAQATSDAMSPLEEATPRYVHELDLSAMGGWQGSPPTTTAMSMSRSSSGPGIAAQGTLISFGDHEPIEIGLAELRSREERERFEAALKRGAFRPMLRDPRRPPPLPYPPTSVMPRGGSDVRSMAEEAAIRGRRRGLSSPAGVNVGLGVDLGGTRPMAIPRRR
ncbi:MAG: hypothetical protein M1832_005579 [Thelocarpon impressellum]|nr:MAG: hypothetical protein M1832_005579 [Thelocarpon impressellum]